MLWKLTYEMLEILLSVEKYHTFSKTNMFCIGKLSIS